jgi:transposase
MKLFLGIDVSKDNLDIHYDGNNVCFKNSLKGLIKLNKLLNKEKTKGNEIALITCEATGGYEKKLVDFMFANQLPIHKANPYKIRSFAEAKGLLAKTDKLDSYIIAEYGKTMLVQADEQKKNAEEELLAELVKRREQLKTDISRETSRLDKELSPVTKKSIKSHLKWLEKEIVKIKKEISGTHKNAVIEKKLQLLTSVPSIGDVTANVLIAFLPELGKYSHKQLTALAGLAPFARESGKFKGKRFIRSGREILRRALYMASLSAIKHYKEMKDFYLRLLSKGKFKKLALIAVARKILLVANSVMRRQTVWKQNFSDVIFCEKIS